ncbi:MAG TPA: peptidyl-prolyl cis-trans isomerase [Bryobacteraceae bacterium]|nr:peptidyl-prolyl cis-trans isomerase [Bryobacteraceae bacterium]
MFNLFRSRDKVVRFFLGALLILVSLSMLTYLIPSYGSGSGEGDTVIADVGKDQVTLLEVQRQLQQAMRNRQVPAEFIPTFIPQVIDQMVTEQALAYEAKRLGYQVSDADLANAIRTILPNLFQDGKFVGKDVYSMVLAQQNLTIPEFEQSLSRQLLASKLRDVALAGIVVSPAEIEQDYRKRKEKVKIEYVKIANDKLRQEIKPTPEELRAAYDANKGAFQVPEKRSLTVVTLDPAKLEQTITPTDADLQRLYNQSKDRFRTPERVKVRHILLKTTDKSPAEEAQIKAKAEDLLKKIKAGADFAELAKKNSEDTGSAAKGGELPDWVVRGQTVPEFEKVAFSLKPHEISDLVKTQYGYHIIQVLAHEDARLQPFEEAKNQLASEYRKQQVTDMMQSLSDKLQAMLTKDPMHPEKAAQELHADVNKYDNLAAGSPVPGIGINKDFDESIAGLKLGQVSQPVLLAGDKLVMAVVTGVTPAHPATFEEAESQVRDQVIKDKLTKLVDQQASELAEKAKAAGGDLAKAAKSMGLEVKTSDDFDRAGAIEGLGSAVLVQEAFSRAAGSVVGPMALADGKLVYKVLSHTEANMAGLAAERDAIREDLKNRKARDRGALFEDGLRQALIQEGKIKIHQQVVNRLIANYRG